MKLEDKFRRNNFDKIKPWFWLTLDSYRWHLYAWASLMFVLQLNHYKYWNIICMSISPRTNNWRIISYLFIIWPSPSIRLSHKLSNTYVSCLSNHKCLCYEYWQGPFIFVFLLFFIYIFLIKNIKHQSYKFHLFSCKILKTMKLLLNNSSIKW